MEVFDIDIDTTYAYPATDDAPLDLAQHPGVRAVVDRIDGEILDAIGRLWYRGKGRLDPETEIRRALRIPVRGWRPGDRLAWNAVLGGVRKDLYVLRDRVFEASETYAPVSGNERGDVVIDLEARTPRGGPAPGRVTVHRSGAAELEPKGEGDQLEQLWAAYRQRHPKYAERFARRHLVMNEVAPRIEPQAPQRRGRSR